MLNLGNRQYSSLVMPGLSYQIAERSRTGHFEPVDCYTKTVTGFCHCEERVRRSNPWPKPTSTYPLMEMYACRRSERNSISKSCRTRAGLSQFQGIGDCFAMLAMTLFCSLICRCFRETIPCADNTGSLRPD